MIEGQAVAAEAEAADVLTVLIVDDEALARNRLRRLLASEAGVHVAGECANGVDAIRLIAEIAPDVVLLDIRLPRQDGLTILRSLPPEVAPAVIFVTAYDAHATEAFDLEALDYVMKPVEPSRLSKALQRARKRRRALTAETRHAQLVRCLRDAIVMTEADEAPLTASRGDNGKERRILVRERDRRFFLPVRDIDWIESFGNYVRLHVGKKVHLIRTTMANLAATLGSDEFVRVHRTAIVNLSRIREIQPWVSGDYVVVLHDGTQLRLGRAYRVPFERRSLV